MKRRRPPPPKKTNSAREQPALPKQTQLTQSQSLDEHKTVRPSPSYQPSYILPNTNDMETRGAADSFAAHLNDFVSNEATDLNAIVQEMGASNSNEKPTSYLQRVQTFEENRELRRGTIHKLRQELQQQQQQPQLAMAHPLQSPQPSQTSKTKVSKMAKPKKRSFKSRAVSSPFDLPNTVSPRQSEQIGRIQTDPKAQSIVPEMNYSNGDPNHHHHSPHPRQYHARSSSSNNGSRLMPSHHQRAVSSGTVDEMISETELNEWHKWVLSQYDFLSRHVQYFDVAEKQVCQSPVLLGASVTNLHGIERTLVAQMRYWIERFGVPAIASHKEARTLKHDLIRVHEEANALEEKLLQLRTVSVAHQQCLHDIRTLRAQINKLEKYKYIHPVAGAGLTINTSSPELLIPTTSGMYGYSRTPEPPRAIGNDARRPKQPPMTPPPPPPSRLPSAAAATAVKQNANTALSLPQSHSHLVTADMNQSFPSSTQRLNPRRRKHHHEHAAFRQISRSMSPNHRRGSHHSQSKSEELTASFPDVKTETRPMLPPRSTSAKQKGTVVSALQSELQHALEKYEALQKQHAQLQREVTDLRQLVLQQNHMNETQSIATTPSTATSSRCHHSRNKSSMQVMPDFSGIVQRMTREKYMWESEKHTMQSEIERLQQEISKLRESETDQNHRVQVPQFPSLKRRVRIDANVAMNEDEIQSLESVPDNHGLVEHEEENIELMTEIDEYENSDDNWMEEDEEEEEEKQATPLLSQSKTTTVAPPATVHSKHKTQPPPPQRPPPKLHALKRKTAKITQVLIPANHLRVEQDASTTPTLSVAAKETAPVHHENGTNNESAVTVLLTDLVYLKQNEHKPKSEDLESSVSVRDIHHRKPVRPAPLRALPTIIANVRRVKKYTFTPRKYGVVTIEASPLWPPDVVAKKPTFYAAIDGLPRNLCLNSNPDELQHRNAKDNILVPMLCFFYSQQHFQTLLNSTQNDAVRDAHFQTQFGQYCCGVIRLDTAECADQRLFLLQTLSLSTALSDETTQHAAAATNDRSELLLHIASNVDHEHKVNIQLHCLRFAHVNDRNEWWKAIQSMVVRRRASAEKRISTHSRNPNLATGKYKMRLHAR